MSLFQTLGSKCSNLTGTGFRGEVNLNDYLGKWVILSTYSPLCEHPSYLKLTTMLRCQNKFSSRNVEVLGVMDDSPYATIYIIDPTQTLRAILHDSKTASIPLTSLLTIVDAFRVESHALDNDSTYNPLCPNIDRIVGEYVLGNPQNVDPELLDFVIYAFALIQPDGTLQVYSERYLQDLANLRFEKPTLKVILAIGGWAADGFSDAALTPTSRYRFAREVQKWLNEYDLDGVDIDWEYPGNSASGIKSRKEDKENFTLLLQALRDVLGWGKWISVAGSGDRGYISNVEIEEIGKIINYFNLMSYDFTAGSFGTDANKHQSNLYPSDLALNNLSVDTYVNNLITAGMPSEKILVGLPLYGRRGAKVTKTFDEIRKSYLNKNGYKVKWDNVAKAPYIVDKEGNFFLAYDNALSIYFKGQYVIDNCLGGLFTWHSGMDQGNILSSAMSSSLNDPLALEEILSNAYFGKPQ